MGTQLILLVGTNPLPIWVAWQYLHKLLEPPVAVRLVYTENTQDEVKRLHAELRDAVFLPDIKTSPGDPAVVRDNIRVAIEPLPPETASIHVHYTGGTKVMAVETVTGLERYREQLRGSFRIDTSYLDPRGDTGPTLINQQGHRLVKDTRQTLLTDLRQIAQLNGFVTGPFVHRYYNRQGRQTRSYPKPAELIEPQMQAGRKVLTEAQAKWVGILAGRNSKWDQTFPQKEEENFIYPEHAGVFSLPEPLQPWQQNLLPLINAMYPHCPWDIATGILSYPARSATSLQVRADLEHMHRFFQGVWLEYAAYDALQQALEHIAKQNNARTNYKLSHGVYIRRAESEHRGQRPRGDNIKPFELDVVAVLGYQLLVVSCSVATGEKEIKQKAMEAIIRARQLGGDEARAIVLCRASKETATNVQAEMEDEMGSDALPLQIWGVQRWNDLWRHFHNYLRNDLHWT